MDGKSYWDSCVNYANSAHVDPDHARIYIKRDQRLVVVDHVSIDSIVWRRNDVCQDFCSWRWDKTPKRAKMIRQKHILITLLVAGILCFYGAHKMLQLDWIDDNMYFRLYAIGILIWSVRHRIQQVSLTDALCGNIIMWLCIFNVVDEVISKTPAAPFKPYIASLIIIITTIYIHHRKCRKEMKSSRS